MKRSRLKRVSKEEEAAALLREQRMNDERLVAKAHELGLGYREQAQPVDEVDDSLVQRSNLHAALAMVPFTSAWYEANFAEDDFDNLATIQRERAKASALLRMTEIGKHEKALAVMRSETKNDFYYFNKLKFKMETEGKYKYVEPVNERMRKEHFKNIFVRAIDMEFIDFHALLQATAQQSAGAGRGCSWRGHTSDGKTLRCSNPRVVHPRRTVMDAINACVKDVLPFCMYHSAECVGEHDDRRKVVHPNELSLCTECYFACTSRRPRKVNFQTASGVHVYDESLQRKRTRPTILSEQAVPGPGSLCCWRPGPKERDRRGHKCTNAVLRDAHTKEFLATCGFHVRLCPRVHVRSRDCVIAAPNELGLCEAHYQHETGSAVPPVDWPFPGTVRVKTKTFTRIATAHWAAPPWPPLDPVIAAPFVSAAPLLGWLSGKSFKGLFAEEAGAHGTLKVGAPSVRGLSSMHSEAVRRGPIASALFLLPIVKYTVDRVARLADMLGISKAARHISRGGSRVPMSIMQSMKSLKSIAKIDMLGGRSKAALKIQSKWRGFLVRNIHVQMAYRKQIRRRAFACVLIQSIVRMRFAKRHILRLLSGGRNEAVMIQKHFRAVMARRLVRRLRAAEKLQRFCHLCRRASMWEGMQIVITLRILFKKTNAPAILIQKLYRGYRVRLADFERRVSIFVYKRQRKLLFRFLLKVVHRRRVHHRMIVEAVVARLVSKRLSRRLKRVFGMHKKNKMYALAVIRSIPELQRFARGFLGRLAARHLKELRQALIDWTRPIYAKVFFDDLLAGMYKIVDGSFRRVVADAAPKQSRVSTLVAGAASDNGVILQSVIPAHLAKFDEIDWRLFLRCLDHFYKRLRFPLLALEASRIVKRFLSPSSGKVNVVAAIDYFSVHTKPCRKHGRLVCGDCVFYRECKIGACECLHFESSRKGSFTGICLVCNHAAVNHRLCPSLLDVSLCSEITTKRPRTRVSRTNQFEGEPRESMKVVLNYPRAPDLSLPIDVAGVFFKDVIKEPPSGLMRVSLHSSIERISEEKTMDLTGPYTSKAFLENTVDLSKVEHDVTYWQDYCSPVGSSKLRLKQLQGLGDICMSKQAPEVEVSWTKFWSVVIKKNPNKSRRQYFESFGQNIPLAFVHNHKLRYTFDGFKIYIYILLELNKLLPIDIHKDNPLLLRLLVDNIVVFEVHWRSMVADIRLGTLDSRIELDPMVRIECEKLLLPCSERAKKLDTMLRDLGFHKNSIGKDITRREFATRKVALPDNSNSTCSDSSCDGQLVPIRGSDGSYICPYPDCGRIFKSNMAAVTHIFDHERLGQLAASAAESKCAESLFERRQSVLDFRRGSLI